MTVLRCTLFTMTIILLLVTIGAVADGGWDLLSPFVAPILALTWQGQFNVDFACYLVLSGIWMAWRGGFSRGSLVLWILAPALGFLFFGPYLIWLVGRSGADPRKLLLGVHAEG